MQGLPSLSKLPSPTLGVAAPERRTTLPPTERWCYWLLSLDLPPLSIGRASLPLVRTSGNDPLQSILIVSCHTLEANVNRSVCGWLYWAYTKDHPLHTRPLLIAHHSDAEPSRSKSTHSSDAWSTPYKPKVSVFHSRVCVHDSVYWRHTAYCMHLCTTIVYYQRYKRKGIGNDRPRPM